MSTEYQQKKQRALTRFQLIASASRPKRKKWSTFHTSTPFLKEPESFLDIQRRTGRKYNGAIAGRF